MSTKPNAVPTAFHYLIGPLYMLTLIYNFNLRKHDAASSGRSGSGRTTDTRLAGTNICMDGGIRACLVSSCAIPGLGLYIASFFFFVFVLTAEVHRTAIVSMDPPDANAPRGIHVRDRDII